MKRPFFLSLTIAIIRDQRLRRVWMFYILLAALVMLFLGSTFFSGALSQNLFWFGIYWLTCAWLTATAFLLAVFDLLLIRVRARRETRELKKRIFGRDDNDGDTPEQPHS
jgi:uncharacterized membrane protein